MENLRNIVSTDYDKIITRLNEWWGGRKMTDMLPRLFFNHFADTSFIIEEEESVKGFLIGFISPAKPSLGYVHFIGVNPNHRNQGIGRKLYQAFIGKTEPLGVVEVECLTAPENELSINFHQSIGFSIKTGKCSKQKGNLLLNKLRRHR